MKLLLDESIPRRLASRFPEDFEIHTVPQMGWTSRSNGELLRLAASQGFDALVTADQGIEFQQNLINLPLPVIVLIARRTRLQELEPLVPIVADRVHAGLEHRVYRITLRQAL